MDKLVPWSKLENLIQPFYYQNTTGRPAYPLVAMLRVHAMQLFYNLSDPAMENALYEIDSMRRFAGLDLTRNLPDETTILKFRHLLEKHGLARKIFECINDELRLQGLLLQQGTLVDASILSAPSSTKNKSGQRDPEMHQTKKGNQWFFGMKMHIGADDVSGAVHSLKTTPANDHDITVADQLRHGEETRVWGDAGYRGIEKREEHKNRKVDWFIAMRPGQRKQLSEDDPRERHIVLLRSSVLEIRQIAGIMHKTELKGSQQRIKRVAWVNNQLETALLAEKELIDR